MEYPTGTVTFLFTDIEGSTKLAQGYPHSWEISRARHHDILHKAIESNNGYIFQIIGDAFCAAFHTAGDALRSAVKSQIDLNNEQWGDAVIKVRMGIHTGKAEIQKSGEYHGYLTMSRIQRLMSAGHGGQVLLSLATEELIRDEIPEGVLLRDMGERRLKDLIRPERIFQLVIADIPSSFPPLKTLDVYQHNLPAQLTSFIGREKEIIEITHAIREQRLVTLTGIGGTGKTRLALQVSVDLIDDFLDGVWFIQLAPIFDATFVPQTVASVLGIREQPARSLTELLIDYMRTKHLLLILDNCEHLVDACARLIGELLQTAPKLNILATSRVTLNVAGEMTYPVHPLTLPDPQRSLPLSALNQYEAVRLFIDRATAVHPAFNVTNINAPAVAQICQHLDGIPLAIELAAARIRALSADQIAARLGDRFNLLTGGSRTALPRQQTLRATMDWSYELLPEDERILLDQLSVFSGSFSLEAVGGVFVGKIKSKTTNMLDLLTTLVDSSLIIMDEGNTDARYHLLETVRQYAFENLQASGELQATQDRHLAYFLDLAEQGATKVQVGQPVWIDCFETEYDNLRTALEYAIIRDPKSAIRMEAALDWFWDYTYRIKEAHTWAIQILSLTEAWRPDRMRTMALRLAGGRTVAAREYHAGQVLLEASLEMARMLDDKRQILEALQNLSAMNYYIGNWAQMHLYAEQLLAVAQELDDKVNISDALWALGTVACGNGDNDLGRTLFVQSLELARKENLPNIIAFALFSLARIAHVNGDFDNAKVLYLECAQIRSQMKHRSALASTLFNLGLISLHESDSIQARALFEESLVIWRELKMDSIQGNSLLGFAGVAGVEGNNELSARLFGAAETANKMLGLNFDDLDHMTYDPIIATVREKLGETAFNVTWESGMQMCLEEAIAYAVKELK